MKSRGIDPSLPRVVEPGCDEHLALIRKAYQPLYLPWWIAPYARDVYRAGRADGERARAAVPSVRRGVVASRNHRVDIAIEFLASASTLAGMKLGSTTLHGAECYLVATLAWCAISWRKSLHGIWPLNIGALGVTLWNLWGALA